MKKFIASMVVALSGALSLSAIPLFPFFVDTAGSYEEGCPEVLNAIGIKATHYTGTPFFSSLKSADEFLNDVLPFSSYTINKEEIELQGAKVTLYTSDMENGQTSTLYLIQLPEGKFFVAYDESAAN